MSHMTPHASLSIIAAPTCLAEFYPYNPLSFVFVRDASYGIGILTMRYMHTKYINVELCSIERDYLYSYISK